MQAKTVAPASPGESVAMLTAAVAKAATSPRSSERLTSSLMRRSRSGSGWRCLHGLDAGLPALGAPLVAGAVAVAAVGACQG